MVVVASVVNARNTVSNGATVTRAGVPDNLVAVASEIMSRPTLWEQFWDNPSNYRHRYALVSWAAPWLLSEVATWDCAWQSVDLLIRQFLISRRVATSTPDGFLSL